MKKLICLEKDSNFGFLKDLITTFSSTKTNINDNKNLIIKENMNDNFTISLLNQPILDDLTFSLLIAMKSKNEFDCDLKLNKSLHFRVSNFSYTLDTNFDVILILYDSIENKVIVIDYIKRVKINTFDLKNFDQNLLNNFFTVDNRSFFERLANNNKFKDVQSMRNIFPIFNGFVAISKYKDELLILNKNSLEKFCFIQKVLNFLKLMKNEAVWDLDIELKALQFKEMIIFKTFIIDIHMNFYEINLFPNIEKYTNTENLSCLKCSFCNKNIDEFEIKSTTKLNCKLKYKIDEIIVKNYFKVKVLVINTTNDFHIIFINNSNNKYYPSSYFAIEEFFSKESYLNIKNKMNKTCSITNIFYKNKLFFFINQYSKLIIFDDETYMPVNIVLNSNLNKQVEFKAKILFIKINKYSFYLYTKHDTIGYKFNINVDDTEFKKESFYLPITGKFLKEKNEDLKQVLNNIKENLFTKIENDKDSSFKSTFKMIVTFLQINKYSCNSPKIVLNNLLFDYKNKANNDILNRILFKITKDNEISISNLKDIIIMSKYLKDNFFGFFKRDFFQISYGFPILEYLEEINLLNLNKKLVEISLNHFNILICKLNSYLNTYKYNTEDQETKLVEIIGLLNYLFFLLELKERKIIAKKICNILTDFYQVEIFKYLDFISSNNINYLNKAKLDENIPTWWKFILVENKFSFKLEQKRFLQASKIFLIISNFVFLRNNSLNYIKQKYVTFSILMMKFILIHSFINIKEIKSIVISYFFLSFFYLTFRKINQEKEHILLKEILPLITKIDLSPSEKSFLLSLINPERINNKLLEIYKALEFNGISKSNLNEILEEDFIEKYFIKEEINLSNDLIIFSDLSFLKAKIKKDFLLRVKKCLFKTKYQFIFDNFNKTKKVKVIDFKDTANNTFNNTSFDSLGTMTKKFSKITSYSSFIIKEAKSKLNERYRYYYDHEKEENSNPTERLGSNRLHETFNFKFNNINFQSFIIRPTKMSLVDNTEIDIKVVVTEPNEIYNNKLKQNLRYEN